LIDRVTHLLLIKFLAGSIQDFFSSNVWIETAPF
jgi:hypothetical protein